MKIPFFKNRERIIKKFLWIPKLYNGNIYWLETVTLQQYRCFFIIPSWVTYRICKPDTLIDIDTPEKQYTKQEPIKTTINRFVLAGVKINKIYPTENPSMCVWNINKKRIFGSNDFETIMTEDGNFKITFDNNRIVYLNTYTELSEESVDKINNSYGIIITNATYNKPHYRFGFIPTE